MGIPSSARPRSGHHVGMPLHHSISPRGLDFIKSFEAYSATPYVCPAGKLTIGYGHVIRKSEPHLRRASLSDQAASALLAEDCKTVEIYLCAVLPDWVRTHHFDALGSFVFNVGIGAFAGSTLRKTLKTGDRQACQAEFDKWIFSNGVRLRGLVIRRACERLMFAGGSDAAIESERACLHALKGPL